MNKIVLILIGMFLIGLVSAPVYQTPGFVNEPNDISSEITLTTNLDKNFKEDSTDKGFPFWILFIVVATLAAIYVHIKFLLKKRRIKKRKGLVPNLIKDALENMEKAKDISKTHEEFDELVKELGLENVIDEIRGGNKDE